MKADYYIAGFFRGQRHEIEQVRPLAWIYTNNKMPEQEVKVKAVYDGNLLALTEDVLCFYDNRRIIDRRRLFKQYGNEENVWVWHELEGCNVKYWMPLPEVPSPAN